MFILRDFPFLFWIQSPLFGRSRSYNARKTIEEFRSPTLNQNGSLRTWKTRQLWRKRAKKKSSFTQCQSLRTQARFVRESHQYTARSTTTYLDIDPEYIDFDFNALCYETVTTYIDSFPSKRSPNVPPHPLNKIQEHLHQIAIEEWENIPPEFTYSMCSANFCLGKQKQAFIYIISST